MASAPSDPETVTGLVDPSGRLVAADGPLAALQVEAGSTIGARLALPQIAEVARLARDLGVPVARAVIAAGARQDFDLWVRAMPDGNQVRLEIEGWRQRVATGPRLDLLLTGDEADAAPPAGSWAVDGALNLTALAPDLAAKLGLDETETAIGAPLTRFLKLEETEDGELPMLIALAARSGFVDQRVVPRKGEATALLLSADPVEDEIGDFAGFAGRALPATNEPSPGDTPVLDVLSGDFNSALRTPLDRIIAAADKIVDRSDGPLRGDYGAYANDIAAAGRHLLSIVQTMGRGQATPAEPVDLVAASSEAIALVAASGQAKRIAVDLLASSRVEAQGDKRAVVQIIVNFLGNAIRHSPPEGAVTINIAAREGRAFLTIADQGPGIAPDDQQRIFDRFERLGEQQPGTGLGLAIARRLASEMGGAIHLDSAPGEGARFTLELALA